MLAVGYHESLCDALIHYENGRVYLVIISDIIPSRHNQSRLSGEKPTENRGFSSCMSLSQPPLCLRFDA